LAAVLVAALVAALIFSSGRQLELWKKIVYTSLFAVWMFLTVGVEMVEETQKLWEDRTENQSVGYEWRSRTNSFAQYATASVFAPLIFTIPFATMVTIQGQENQMLLNGANFTKNIMSGLTILALFLLLVRGDWRKHVLPIAVMCGYLVVLVFSNFAHSERFHFPALAFELMFAAYGVSQLTNKHKRWYTIWIIVICVANIAWSYIKLAGRGFAV
jgi:Ca2+/Na+ antiporter